MAFSTFQETAKASALQVAKNAPTVVAELQATLASAFANAASPSTLAEYYSASVASNDAAAASLASTLDAVHKVLQDFAALELYITLTLPKMEDGNNFGVTVQLSALKTLQDAKEKMEKGVEELSKYASARADAMEKCKFPSETTTTSRSVTSSEGTCTPAKEDATTSEQKTLSEEKKSSSVVTMKSPDMAYREQAVTAVDVLYVIKAKALFQASLIGYLSVMDFYDKNTEKIDMPKGSRGSGAAYSSMY